MLYFGRAGHHQGKYEDSIIRPNVVIISSLEEVTAMVKIVKCAGLIFLSGLFHNIFCASPCISHLVGCHW